jgi:hypothetical protein
MWKNNTERGRVQMAIWRMRIACWTPKVKNTHSEYAILISFRRQESSSMLRYTYVARLVSLSVCHPKTTFTSDLLTTEDEGNSPGDGYSLKTWIFCHTDLETSSPAIFRSPIRSSLWSTRVLRWRSQTTVQRVSYKLNLHQIACPRDVSSCP